MLNMAKPPESTQLLVNVVPVGDKQLTIAMVKKGA